MIQDYVQEIFQKLTPHFALNQDDSNCPPPSTPLLFLVGYIVFSGLGSLALGSTTLRKKLAQVDSSTSPTRARIVSISGSLIIQCAATVVTAHTLKSSPSETASDPGAPLSRMTILWFSRPLATTVVTWLSIVDHKIYRNNSEEIFLVDSIYSLVNIFLFGAVAHITNHVELPLPTRMARAGSALGLLSLILTPLWALWVWVCIRIYPSLEKPERENEVRQVCASLPLSLAWSGLSFLACWLLWAGLLFGDITAFCPTKSAMTGVTMIWLFTPVVDHLWRGFATCKRKKEEDGRRYRALTVSH